MYDNQVVALSASQLTGNLNVTQAREQDTCLVRIATAMGATRKSPWRSSGLSPASWLMKKLRNRPKKIIEESGQPELQMSESSDFVNSPARADNASPRQPFVRGSEKSAV